MIQSMLLVLLTMAIIAIVVIVKKNMTLKNKLEWAMCRILPYERRENNFVVFDIGAVAFVVFNMFSMRQKIEMEKIVLSYLDSEGNWVYVCPIKIEKYMAIFEITSYLKDFMDGMCIYYKHETENGPSYELVIWD